MSSLCTLLPPWSIAPGLAIDTTHLRNVFRPSHPNRSYPGNVLHGHEKSRPPSPREGFYADCCSEPSAPRLTSRPLKWLRCSLIGGNRQRILNLTRVRTRQQGLVGKVQDVSPRRVPEGGVWPACRQK